MRVAIKEAFVYALRASSSMVGACIGVTEITDDHSAGVAEVIKELKSLGTWLLAHTIMLENALKYQELRRCQLELKIQSAPQGVALPRKSRKRRVGLKIQAAPKDVVLPRKLTGHCLRLKVQAALQNVVKKELKIMQNSKVNFSMIVVTALIQAGVAEVIKELKSLGNRSAMLTGDSEIPLDHALEVVHAELLPTLLAIADIGISMRISGSAPAIDTTHKAIRLARQARWKVIENVIMSTKSAILALAFAGHPLVWAAVLADVGTDFQWHAAFTRHTQSFWKMH
ncbi:hypothetical protein SADUNF_Sadunf11G0064300 [Salix dunnii]|uniref:Uncharacterized protein n=1 Tax=Salix dunnii TaxID=1413687 RepID=A0A835JMU8_9ROSI|nr:hypothetical protein SADUNF_Sadunf11G0064300 [Salix dunnii]